MGKYRKKKARGRVPVLGGCGNDAEEKEGEAIDYGDGHGKEKSHLNDGRNKRKGSVRLDSCFARAGDKGKRSRKTKENNMSRPWFCRGGGKLHWFAGRCSKGGKTGEKLLNVEGNG